MISIQSFCCLPEIVSVPNTDWIFLNLFTEFISTMPDNHIKLYNQSSKKYFPPLNHRPYFKWLCSILKMWGKRKIVPLKWQYSKVPGMIYYFYINI